MSDPRHALGRRAEEAVAGWLGSSGWSVLDRRWRVPEGELDLVCLDPDGWLVGVEVRARRTERAGRADETVDRRRLTRLRAALRRYRPAGERLPPRGLRIDLVTVAPGPTAGRWHLRRHPAVDGW